MEPDKQPFRFRMVTYYSNTRCYYYDYNKKRWRITSKDIPDSLKKTGIPFEIDEIKSKDFDTGKI